MKISLYTGSYADTNEAGICRYEINGNGVSPTASHKISGISNPSYLTLSETGEYLYAVLEDMTFEGHEGGGVASFKKEGDCFYRLNQKGTVGTLPCHILLDEGRNYLFTGNYMSGSISMFRLNEDGSIGEMADFIQHEGSGPNLERQEGPHVHFIGFSKDKEGIWCVDLGLDKIFYYKIDSVNSKLIHRPEMDLLLPAGVGPRHFVLNTGIMDIMYIISELSSEIFVVNLWLQSEKIVQRISTLPEGTKDSACAAIKISEDQRFLYASNRGDDSIAIFRIEPETGQLKLVEITKTCGKIPRDFALNSDHLYVANQESNEIAVFKIDNQNGGIEFLENKIPCKSPVCLVIH